MDWISILDQTSRAKAVSGCLYMCGYSVCAPARLPHAECPSASGLPGCGAEKMRSLLSHSPTATPLHGSWSVQLLPAHRCQLHRLPTRIDRRSCCLRLLSCVTASNQRPVAFRFPEGSHTAFLFCCQLMPRCFLAKGSNMGAYKAGSVQVAA